MLNRVTCAYLTGIIGILFMVGPTVHSLLINLEDAIKINPRSAMRWFSSSKNLCVTNELIKINSNEGDLVFTYAADKPNVKAVSLYFATYKRENKGSFDISFESGINKFKQAIETNNLKDNGEKVFLLDFKSSEIHPLVLTISNVKNTIENTVAFWACLSDAKAQPSIKIHYNVRAIPKR